MSAPRLPIVALVGRTNVGKSTLFNRLIEQSKALVSPQAGTTRDRHEGECLWRGHTIRMVDTGGLDVNKRDEIEQNIALQSEIAMKGADLILFVVDMKAPPTAIDLEVASKLWKMKAPVIVVGNKAEKASERKRADDPEWRLRGLPAPLTISAVQGTGVGDLLDAVYVELEKRNVPPVEYAKLDATRIAVIGKPNVGKSTLLNALIGEERFITSSIAHTTREPNDVLLHVGDQSYLFYDTAGMRKHAKTQRSGGLEKLAVNKNASVIREADVCLLVLDATEPIGAQEKTLAGLLKDSGNGLVIIVNKWDLVEDKNSNTMNDYRAYIKNEIPFLTWAPVLFVSALTKQRVQTIYATIDEVQTNRSTKLGSRQLQTFLDTAVHQHLPALGKGSKPPKILGMKQVASHPPTFDLIIRANRKDSLHPSYLRFLENRLRETHNFAGTPMRMNIRIARSVSK